MIPLRPTVSDIVSRASRSEPDGPRDLGNGLRLVMTWTDLPCGCCRNDRGAWIVSGTCPAGHRSLMTADQRADMRAVPGADFGPFVPGEERGPRPSDSSPPDDVDEPEEAAWLS